MAPRFIPLFVEPTAQAADPLIRRPEGFPEWSIGERRDISVKSASPATRGPSVDQRTAEDTTEPVISKVLNGYERG